MLLRGFISGLIITAKLKQSFCQRDALQNSEHLLHIDEEDQSNYKCFHGGYLSSNCRGACTNDPGRDCVEHTRMRTIFL